MRKFTASLVLLAATLMSVAVAQTAAPTSGKLQFASAFNAWSIPGQAPNTYTFTSPQICQIGNPYSSRFYGFNSNAPILISDLATVANSEVVAITPTTTPCGFTATFAHSHSNFVVSSGTAGLQEAINAALNGSAAHASPIMLDAIWWTSANALPGTSGAAVIAAAVGSTKVDLVDTTTAPWTWYGWSGTAYVSLGGGAGGQATANGASVVYGSASELLVLSTTGATSDTTANLLPANSFIDAVVARVTTAINNVTTWQLGDGSTPGRFSATQSSLTLGSTFAGPQVQATTGVASTTTGVWQTSAAHVRVTTAGGTQNTTGAIRITVFYHTVTPPSS